MTRRSTEVAGVGTSKQVVSTSRKGMCIFLFSLLVTNDF